MITADIPQPLIKLVNQLFDMERKLEGLTEAKALNRNIRRMKDAITELGINYENPLGQRYDETRTDCEASITGQSTQQLVIIEVIKPIIRVNIDGYNHIIQRGIVIVQGS